MALDGQLHSEAAASEAEQLSTLSLFSQAFSYELRLQCRGLTQLFGASAEPLEAPAPAATSLGAHAQMFGRGVADAIPSLATAMAIHYSLGRVTSPEFSANLLLKRSALGLSMLEAGATGLVTGALLKPTEPEKSESFGGLLLDRSKSGVMGALSFGALTATNSLLSRQGEKLAAGVERTLLTNPIASGVLSGLPGGFINAQLQSVAGDGRFTTDSAKIGQAVYEMSLFGGVFGAVGIAARGAHEQFFSPLSSLQQIYRRHSPAGQRLVELKEQGAPLVETKEFLSEKGGRQDLVRTALEFKGAPSLFSRQSLEALESVQRLLKLDNSALARVMELHGHGLNLATLANSLSQGTLSMRSFVDGAIRSGASVEELVPGRVKALSRVGEKFGEDSETYKRLLALDVSPAKLVTLSQVWKHLAHPESLIQEAVEIGDAQKVDYPSISARVALANEFAADPAVAGRLKELDRQGLDTVGLWKFIAENRPRNAKEVVAGLVESGAGKEQLTFPRLIALQGLEGRYGKDSETVQRLLQFEGSRVKLPEIEKFASEKLHNEKLIAKVVSEPVGPRGIDVKQLGDQENISSLSAYFSSEPVIERIANLQSSGRLSVARLLNYVGDNPESRRRLVKELVDRNADSRYYNQIMDLSVLPDDVAYRLVENENKGGARVARLVSDLRDWDSGRYLRDLITDHVRRGEALLPERLDRLDAQAKAIAADKERSASSLPGRVGQFAANMAEKVEAGIKTGFRGEARHVLRAIDLLDTVTDAAQTLKKSARKIDALFPADKPIVLLGRDSWPLAPLLREQGRNVQYFLWSRLQVDDLRTQAQWLKEVPPHAVVIDTGTIGSILSAINKVDPSTVGYLIESYGVYPSLMGNRGAIAAIEKLPKMIGRAETYTENGGAITKQRLRDDEDRAGGSEGGFRWTVERKNMRLLRALGMPEWDVWRYSNYVGLTPAERLFAGSNSSVQEHLERVRALRGH